MLEQKNQGRAKFKFAVFCVIGVHVVGLMALLLTQGCKREQAPVAGDVQPPLADVNTNLPVMDAYSNNVAYGSSNAVPAANPIPEPAPLAPSATEHVIVKGDTFYDLAKKYGVTMQALKDANPTVNPSKLQLNQKIVIPAPVAHATTDGTATPAPVTNPGETTYKVVSGDNLTKIGAKFGVSASAIRNANNLTSDRIVVGQTLKIPAKSAPPQ